jgi:aspartyl aminopeptidase
LLPGGKYYFIRGGTTLIGFSVGLNFSSASGVFTVFGAHTDSPCLKIKPVTCFKKLDALVLNTQPYGGGLWHTWFDRDLGLAGRLVLKTENGFGTKLFRIDRPIARIPNLAIHLTTGSERENFAPNLQEHAKAIISMDPSFINTEATTEEEKEVSPHIPPSLLRLLALEANIDPSSIEDVEMQLIDVQPATIGGASDELLFGGRLDNLCSTYQVLRSLIDASNSNDNNNTEQSNIKMALLFDHEEVGSSSFNGAGSNMFVDTLKVIQESLGDGSNGFFYINFYLIF